MCIRDRAIHDRAIPYYDNNAPKVDSATNRDINKRVYEDKLRLQKNASKKAGWILHQCELKTHPYLMKKGFDKLMLNVYENNLIIPMFIESKLSGLQIIAESGDKKFLYGQNNNLAVHVLDQCKSLYMFFCQ